MVETHLLTPGQATTATSPSPLARYANPPSDDNSPDGDLHNASDDRAVVEDSTATQSESAFGARSGDWVVVQVFISPTSRRATESGSRHPIRWSGIGESPAPRATTAVAASA